ncbi:MAG: sugar phosphate nucleotidyltransferase [Acidobacteriota bacterium]|nr:sugar phosphate nucleotidyltransferase [Acidobacteriota bacterium]MDH3784079.1 sugar phosphate nucleotidyltransferase [Acidobacteriota bacterium]
MAARRPPFHVVLLAGGSGTRFWPLSRKKMPKQFHALTGRESLLLATWRRVRKLTPKARIWVVAPRALARSVRRELPDLQKENLVLEPSPRDTAPAIALACAAVERREPGSIVGIFPTDHVIRDSTEFVRTVRVAATVAAEGSLVCLGIRPDRPATGFGYLHCATRAKRRTPTIVKQFVEKPDLARARRFLRTGRYLWNAGMFVWRADRFLEEIEKTAPRIRRAVDGHLRRNRKAWVTATRLSVDYAVMEHASDVRVVPLDAGWDDVGSWDAVARLREEGVGNDRRHVLVDSEGSVVIGSRRLVALVGVENLAVVDTEDALLIVSRERSEEVRTVVETLKKRRQDDLL